MGPDIDMKFHQEVMEIVSYDSTTKCNVESGPPIILPFGTKLVKFLGDPNLSDALKT